jgi:hypothetical protein
MRVIAGVDEQAVIDKILLYLEKKKNQKKGFASTNLIRGPP